MSLVEADYEQDGDLIEYVENTAALEAINRSEIDIQITTAKRFPRSITAFKRQALEMATLDEETAGSMFYAVPRGGKKIEGPSVRLAEVVGSSWGNLRYGARVVSTDDKFVTAQGMCYDLEKNISAAVEVKRRITNSRGERYNDDMIQVTSNAASAIALRQAIFKVVPFAFVKPIYEQARLTSLGKAKTIGEHRKQWLEWFQKAGATQQQVLEMLGKKGVDDITLDDCVTLRGISNAIKDGETTVEQIISRETGKAASRAKKSELTPSKQDEPDRMTQIEQGFADAVDAAAVEMLYDSLKGPEAIYEFTPEQSDRIEQMRVQAMGRFKGKKQKELG